MHRTGRLAQFDEEWLNQLIHEDSRQTTRELAEIMKCSHSTLERHLHSIGKVQKLGAWVPHALNDNNKNQQATISAGLLACHQSTHEHKQQFLYWIVTSDKKWCLYVNMKQRKEWLSPDKRATPRAKRRCAYGGTGKAWSTTNCLIGTKQWMRNFMSNKCNNSTTLSSKNDLRSATWHSSATWQCLPSHCQYD